MSESNHISRQLYDELCDFCNHESISEEGLREIIERHGLTPNNHLNCGVFLQTACDNRRVTEGIIRCLLEYFPAAATTAGYGGYSAVHEACNNKNVTLGIIQLLIDAAPDSVRFVNERGEMPLHTLCHNSLLDETAEVKICKFLIERYPGAACHANCWGDLPIDLASNRRSPEFCQVLIDAFSDNVRKEDKNGWTPLHTFCGKKALYLSSYDRTAMETLKFLLKEYPEAAWHANNEGRLPIHLASCWGRPPEFCQVLIEAVPDSVHKEDRYGWMPLHTAPESVRKEDKYGWMPLHTLCDNPEVDGVNAMQTLEFLIEKHPGAVLHADNNGSLPIHLACVSKSPEFCQVLIEAAPDSVHSTNKYGWSPLHFLCGVSVRVGANTIQTLKLLIEEYPEAVSQVCNDNGRLPIHDASLLRSPEFCRLLIEACPGSEQRTTTHGALPLHWACAGNTLPTVEYLLRLFPDAINRPAQDGLYPIHGSIINISRRVDPRAAVGIVQLLLDFDPNQNLVEFQRKSLLQYACEHNDPNIEAGIEMIKILFDSHPEAIEEDRFVSNVHRYHQQVQSFINGELVYARQANNLRLMMTPDDNGRLPLHRALQDNVRLGSIKLLVNGNSSAIRSFDKNGVIPLHVACQYHDSDCVVGYMVSLADETLDTIDRQGNTALHYACRGAKYQTIALLLEKYDATSVSKWNAHKKLPIELLWESNAVEDRESVEYTDCVFRLLKAFPETLTSTNTTQSFARLRI